MIWRISSKKEKPLLKKRFEVSLGAFPPLTVERSQRGIALIQNFRRWEAGLDGQSEGTSIKRLF
ncbi:unnamed protein product, partial [Vitis vinifera]